MILHIWGPNHCIEQPESSKNKFEDRTKLISTYIEVLSKTQFLRRRCGKMEAWNTRNGCGLLHKLSIYSNPLQPSARSTISQNGTLQMVCRAPLIYTQVSDLPYIPLIHLNRANNETADNSRIRCYCAHIPPISFKSYLIGIIKIRALIYITNTCTNSGEHIDPEV